MTLFSLLASALLAVLALLIGWLLYRKIQRLNEQLQDYQAQLRTLKQEQLLLQQTASEAVQSSLGLGKKISLIEQHLTRNEQKYQQLKQSLADISLQDPAAKLYNRANKLAQKGADIQELIDECEISRAEAELIISLWQKK
ncbi:DUF2802 domain-containing protein [Gayadomonas joobiniege]|uniref:DUF2802 domain-containing protein n=1 Tax=Gayadomonas joobiniege TaxID=1234606 RepID=UPI00036E41B1|nr:DUF2802 domain-containing protein [Gayadomonas joobiniege]